MIISGQASHWPCTTDLQFGGLRHVRPVKSCIVGKNMTCSQSDSLGGQHRGRSLPSTLALLLCADAACTEEHYHAFGSSDRVPG